LQSITDFYKDNGKVDLNKDLIQVVVDLGGYGKNVTCRRYSTFICSCLMQV